MRALVVLALVSLLAAASAASEVRVPMRVDFAFMRGLLIERAFSDPGETARVYSDGVECNRVTLLRPQLDAWRELYGDLQLATAWQETCWRQYVRLTGTIRPLRSRAGAVGLMQVNARAWRGFYDARGLTADIAYKSRAGSEILLHYWLDLALAKGEHKRPSGSENLVRATYAAYNGGPSHLTRYRRASTRKGLRAIDASLFRKYEAVRGGRELEVARCFG